MSSHRIMLSSKSNILQLTSLMLKKGISDVVVCPGSRNAPLIHTFASAGMQCYEITDERSAGFFALGLIDAKERPIAVCCTSGSAVLNLAPAVTEAFYRPLPLLVITADRPEQWIGQMDGQTMPQQSAFGQTVQKTVSVPESEDSSWYANRLINEALLTLERTKGPVHINIPLSEPLFEFTATALPDTRVISQSPSNHSAHLSDESISIWRNAHRPMIIIGQLQPIEARRVEKYLCKLRSHGVVILAEELSNIKQEYVTNRYFDNVIAQETGNNLLPDLVVTFGGHIVSKNLKQWLRKFQPQHHWSIRHTGDVADLFQCLTMVWECNADSAVELLSQHLPLQIDTDYTEEWGKSIGITPMKPRSWELDVLERALKDVPDSWNIHVANSSMVRDIQKLPSTGCNIYCNRGINGIEGSVSAAIGLAAGNGKSTLLLIGDLSFFYDKNGLWNNYAKGGKLPDGGQVCLSILLINNEGGRIFQNIPGMERTPYRDTMVSGKHTTTAEGVAIECNCGYKAISCDTGLDKGIEWLLGNYGDSDKRIRILEVHPSCSSYSNQQ